MLKTRGRRWAILMSAALLMVAAPVAAAPTSAPAAGELERRLDGAKNLMLTAPDRTILVAQSVERSLREATAPRAKRQLAMALWLHGEALVRLDRLEQADPPLKRALALATRFAPNSSLEGNIRLSRAWISAMHGDVATALADYHRSYAIFHAANEARSEAVALMSISELYRKARDFARALRYARRAQEVGSTDAALRFSVSNNVGATLGDLGRHQEALQQYRNGLGAAVQLGSHEFQAVALRNIARAELNLGHSAEARAAIARGLALERDDPMAMAQFASIAAEVARKAGDDAIARREIERAFAGMDLSKTTLAQRDAHESAYLLYRRTGDLNKALAHLEALKRLDDQATSLAASANTALMGARFDFKSQELRIATLKASELQRSIAFERTKRESQQTLFGVAAAAGVIVVCLLTAFGLAMRRKRNQLAITNAELERALAARTEFLASTSHEIRTPLNGILGMAQVMLADPSAPPAMRERLEVVKGAGLTMRALVDDILDVAKMETGQFTVSPHPMNLRETLAEVTRLWADQAGQRGIAFQVDLSDCPGAIEGDASRIRQIVFNLLSNAIKFTGEGGVIVSARPIMGAQGEERVRVAVRDTGIGIPEDKLAAIFEAFRQVDASTTRTYGGTGLGLTICRKLARTMGGDVIVESEIAKGSTFTLDLPITRLAEIEAEPEFGSPEPASLVVDRSPIGRVMMKTILEKRGAVTCANSLEEAVDLIGKGGVLRIAVDEGALGQADERAGSLAQLLSAAGSVPIAVLGTGEGLNDVAGTVLIPKPVTAAALIGALFDEEDDYRVSENGRGLVSRAA